MLFEDGVENVHPTERIQILDFVPDSPDSDLQSDIKSQGIPFLGFSQDFCAYKKNLKKDCQNGLLPEVYHQLCNFVHGHIDDLPTLN